MAIIREFEVKANTDEAVKSVEELKYELEESKEKAQELEEALADANREAAKGSREASDANREATRAKEETIRTIDRASGGYLEMGRKASKAYKVIKAELVRAIAASKAWVASISWSSIVKGVQAFGLALKTSFIQGTIGAKALRVAIASTGLGLVVVSVGMIVAYWDDIVDATTGYNSQLDKAIESATKIKDSEQATLDAITESENVLREQGKTEEEIQRLKEMQTEEIIKAAKIELDATKTKRKAELESNERQRAFVKGILEFFLVIPRMAAKAIDWLINKVPKKIRDWIGIGTSNVAGGIEDMINATTNTIIGTAEEATAETDALIDTQEKNLRKLENSAAGYRLERRRKEQEAYRKAQEDAERHAAELRRIERETRKINEQIALNAEDDALQRERLRYRNELKAIDDRFDDEWRKTKAFSEERKALREKYNAERKLAEQEHEKAVKEIQDNSAAGRLKSQQDFEDLQLELLEEGKDKEIKIVETKYQRLRQEAGDNQKKIKALNELEKREKAAIEDKFAKEELEKARSLQDLKLGLQEDGVDKELQALEYKYERLKDAAVNNEEELLVLQQLYEKEKADVQKKFDDEAITKRKDYQNQIADIVIDAAKATIDNLIELNNMYDEDDKAAAQRAFERNKSLQIVQAIINTAGGIMGELNNPTGVVTGANWLKAAVIASTGATQIATISRQQFDGDKGTSSASPKAPAVPQVGPSFNIVGQSNTNQLLQGIATQFSNPLRAYVVGGDVTSSQEMERKRIKTATFG